jgi:hypothetical protein
VQYHSNARWYDADTARFVSEDPARDGLAWYAYVRSNPIRYVDPTGLDVSWGTVIFDDDRWHHSSWVAGSSPPERGTRERELWDDITHYMEDPDSPSSYIDVVDNSTKPLTFKALDDDISPERIGQHFSDILLYQLDFLNSTTGIDDEEKNIIRDNIVSALTLISDMGEDFNLTQGLIDHIFPTFNFFSQNGSVIFEDAPMNGFIQLGSRAQAFLDTYYLGGYISARDQFYRLTGFQGLQFNAQSSAVEPNYPRPWDTNPEMSENHQKQVFSILSYAFPAPNELMPGYSLTTLPNVLANLYKGSLNNIDSQMRFLFDSGLR